MFETNAPWGPSEQKAQLLIIGDNVENIVFLSSLLKDKAEVLFATTPEAGIRLAQRERPQLVLLDVEEADTVGIHVCRRLRADSNTCDIPILFATAPDHESVALEAGAVDVLNKPLNGAVVTARVQTHLSLHEKSEQLALLACYDGLTGICNRRHFDERLREEVRRHQRQSLSLGVALVDVDLFKAYNDGYGHLMGDGCLREIAQAIAENTRRPGELVCRYGGEEFAAILPNIDQAGMVRYGEWICDRIRELQLAHAFSSVATVVTVSVGLTAFVPSVGNTAKDLIGRADHAMYLAKGKGRNCSEFAGQ